MLNATKICTSCHTELTLDNFYKKLDGTTSRCKECTKKARKAPEFRSKANEYRREYYRQNRENCAIWSKSYQERNLEKFREYSKKYYSRFGETRKGVRGRRDEPSLISLSGRVFQVKESDYRKLLARQRNLCASCLCNLSGSIHLDHIFPLSKGGRHSVGNIQFLCQRCNQEKGDLFYADFKNKKR